MSILTGSEIRKQVEAGRIKIDPFDPSLLNPNSIDFRLGDTMLIFQSDLSITWLRRDHNFRLIEPEIRDYFLPPKKSWRIEPGSFYLAHTMETIGSDFYVPVVHGKSSLARCSLQIHQTGAWVDIGFRGQITLEITCTVPLLLYVGQRIGQLSFETVEGDIDILYGRDQGRYQNQSGPTPAREEKT